MRETTNDLLVSQTSAFAAAERRMPSSRTSPLRAAILSLACVLPTSAAAVFTTDNVMWPNSGEFPAYPLEPDERPIRVSASAGYYRDSNLFRLSDNDDAQAKLGTSERSDRFWRAGLDVKGDIPISRQRLLFDAGVDDYHYDTFDFLDHLAYRVRGAWKWQLTSPWSGDLGYSQRRYLAGFGEVQARIKDLLTEDRAYGSAAYLATPRWRVRGAADWYRYDHSDPTRATLDSRTTSGTVGLDYLTPAGNSVGTQVKYTLGKYPNRQVVAGSTIDNEYDEIEASAVAHWEVTGKSILDARLGYTSRMHRQLSERDFQGATGRLNWDWTPGAKTLISFIAWHEIRSDEEIDASYILATGASIGPSWAPTTKLVFQGRAFYENRDFEGDPGFVLTDTPERKDKVYGWNVATGYAPWRYVAFAIAYEQGRRTSNEDLRDYDYDLVSANAKISF